MNWLKVALTASRAQKKGNRNPVPPDFVIIRVPCLHPETISVNGQVI